jgi:hypothetical protein
VKRTLKCRGWSEEKVKRILVANVGVEVEATSRRTIL